MLKHISFVLLATALVIAHAQNSPKTKTDSSGKPAGKSASTAKTQKPKEKSAVADKGKKALPVKLLINGELEGYKNHLIVISKFKYNQLTFIDSTRTDANGKFTFNKGLDENSIVYVQYSTTTAVPVITQNNTVCNLKILTGASGLNYTMDGSNIENSLSLFSFLKNYTNYINELGGLESQIASEADAIKSYNMQMEFAQKQQMLRSSVDSMVRYKSPLESYFVLFNIMDEQKPADLKSIMSRMEPANIKSTYYQDLKTIYQNTKSLEPGEIAPDIELPQPDGSILKLSSLRGKVVLIDFWASWCGPCRAEFPNVKRVYGRFKEKGFEIFGVSLDRDKQSWTMSIKNLGLNWYHVSDLKEWSAAPAKLYKVHSIPFTVLIDAEGRIIAKNLRGEELEKKLEELFP